MCKQHRPPQAMAMITDPWIQKRFIKKLHVVNANNPDSCWDWTAYCDPKTKYGQFYMHASMQWAHRVAYAIFVGPIPAGIVIHHTCHNRKCCNPAHLRHTTHTNNVIESNQHRSKTDADTTATH